MDEKKQSMDNNNEDQLEVPKQRYPRSVAFIIGNEFCERFSYYGAKAILVIFFTQIIKYSDDEATEYYHIFAMACYFTPVIGAIIADSFLGKFSWVMWIGLVAIALGTGGIKPCVSAFGGDQFGPGMERQLQKFFSFFYISINAGSLLSTFITPILREDVQCFNKKSCFPLAFGVPAVLMIVALILFVVGRYVTNYVMVPPKKESVVVQVISCVFTSLSRKWFKRMPKRDHWLDYADDKFDSKTIADIKAVMRVLFLYLPLPIFWALFDQQGSRWTLQATKMDGKMGDVYRLKPDQIQVVNPILIILFIPVFEYIIYPAFAKINFLKKSLQRIVCGGILAAVAFAICGFFQLSIETDLPPTLNDNSIHLTIVNGLSTPILLKNSFIFGDKSETIEKYGVLTKANLNIDEFISKGLSLDVSLTDNSKIAECSAKKDYSVTISKTFAKGGILLITESICSANAKELSIFEFNQKIDILEKPKDGGSFAGVVYNIKDSVTKPVFNIVNNNHITFRFNNSEFTDNFNSTTVGDPIVSGDTKRYVGYVPFIKELDVHLGGEYKLFLLENDTESAAHVAIEELGLYQGGAYIALVYTDDQGKLKGDVHNIVLPNSVSMFWQITQYSVITAGEIMFSITGLEFSYSQAPASMKSVLQAAWLLTVAFGNLIIVIISSAKIFEKQTFEEPKKSLSFYDSSNKREKSVPHHNTTE
ncbi:unnamed protein product [Medioppia subpectinata]|uniref:Oligopeptide transporter 1 n=2 Tax=Medioppia subpectinata TaxID=1979941 RepID=A0A7R9KB82_9ACAR|nr:unnamed protein product [Medioppia subpectinata]CAG2100098.1 unnamed protein product [Medioppia subpectinata]